MPGFKLVTKYRKQINMKKLRFIFPAVLALFLCVNAKAQTRPTDFFPGKWMVSVAGTPRGDVKMIFVLERKDGKLAGAVQDSTGKEMTKITSIEEKNNTISAYFNVHEIDLMLQMEEVDNDHITGNMLGMFYAQGVRLKENTQ